MSLGHLGLPSSGQHLFEQSINGPPPEILFISDLDTFFKFFILINL